MTVSPDRRPVVVADLDEAIDVVRRSGLRLTSARRLVLEALLAAREPISAEEIADGLGGRMTQLDIASVYRNLETLGSLGLVRHFHAGHGPGRYVLEGLGDREYLACEGCGALESVEPAALDGVRDQVRALSGFEVRFAHFPIVGLCPACARKRPAGHVHEQAHEHEHKHDGEAHAHPHATHDHDHVEHAHEHAHGDETHGHPHLHEAGLEEAHQHGH